MIKEIVVLESPNPYARRLEYYVDDKAIGYLEYSFIYDRIEVDQFEVLDDYRGQGVGKKLLSYLIFIGIREHVVSMTLEVRVSNTVARELYKSFGFREVALRKFYYGDEDGILMEKQVM